MAQFSHMVFVFGVTVRIGFESTVVVGEVVMTLFQDLNRKRVTDALLLLLLLVLARVLWQVVGPRGLLYDNGCGVKQGKKKTGIKDGLSIKLYSCC